MSELKKYDSFPTLNEFEQTRSTNKRCKQKNMIKELSKLSIIQKHYSFNCTYTKIICLM